MNLDINQAIQEDQEQQAEQVLQQLTVANPHVEIRIWIQLFGRKKTGSGSIRKKYLKKLFDI